MKPLIKALICSSLCFMFLFVCVGYAALISSLDIEGNAEVKFVEGLYITNISEVSTYNIDKMNFPMFPILRTL